MLETSARLLRLLSLFQSRRYLSGAELAAELGVTARTLRRDVDKLRKLGYPIHSSAGTEGGYQMGAGATMPPLLLDDEEAVAVFVGLHQIAGAGAAPARALAKMEQLLPPRLVGRVGALQSVVVAGAAGTAVDGKLLTFFASACRDLMGVRFRYSDHGGKVSVRRVEPYRLVYSGGRWYLVGWDLDREDWRTFRVDRVGERPTTEKRFPAREGPTEDLRAFVTDGYWRSLEKVRGRVRIFLSAEEAGKRYSSGIFEAVGDQECIWDVGGRCWEHVAAMMGWMAAEFRVEGPAELIEAVRKMGEQLQRGIGVGPAGKPRRISGNRPAGRT